MFFVQLIFFILQSRIQFRKGERNSIQERTLYNIGFCFRTVPINILKNKTNY